VTRQLQATKEGSGENQPDTEEAVPKVEKGSQADTANSVGDAANEEIPEPQESPDRVPELFFNPQDIELKDLSARSIQVRYGKESDEELKYEYVIYDTGYSNDTITFDVGEASNFVNFDETTRIFTVKPIASFSGTYPIKMNLKTEHEVENTVEFSITTSFVPMFFKNEEGVVTLDRDTVSKKQPTSF
jgi:hypothetical protein